MVEQQEYIPYTNNAPIEILIGSTSDSIVISTLCTNTGVYMQSKPSQTAIMKKIQNKQ